MSCGGGPPGQWGLSSFALAVNHGITSCSGGPPGQWDISKCSTAINTPISSTCSGGPPGLSSVALDHSGMDSDSLSTISLNDDVEHTILIMRNIPSTYSRSALLTLLDQHGFSCSYNLV